MLMSFDLTTGLSFDSVCMPRLTPAAYMRAGPEAHLLFTGITRAARWAYLSFVWKELPALEALRSLVEQGVVVRKD